MLVSPCLGLVLAIVLLTTCCIRSMAEEAPPVEERAWWLQPQRLLQTNLREIDATMDLERYVREVRESGASVVLFNAGGIVANYPTELPFHFRNPHMKGDLLGATIGRLHAEGLRVIGRFDFSKVNETIAAQHPEWLYVSERGAQVNYNGQVHACFNGEYQQERIFDILGEALTRYPLDGIFFNMPGYQQHDYSGNYHGICQSEACRARFKKETGLELPRKKDPNDPVCRRYEAFCRETADALYGRIQQFVRARRPGLMILNYRAGGSDVVRAESNRPFIQWAYEDTEKSMRRRLEHPEKPLANAAVHFIDYPQRHAGVSPTVTARRLHQEMLQGQWLDFYCIGPLQRLEDRLSVEVVRDAFRFHAAHRAYFSRLQPGADVGLAASGGDSYRGLFDALSEQHVSFDLVSPERTALERFAAVAVPDAQRLNAEACARLDAYVEAGGRLLLLGEVPVTLKAAGLQAVRTRRERTPGDYVRIRAEDKERLQQGVFESLDLVYLDGAFVEYERSGGCEGLLRLIPQAMFGPPERCYYTGVSEVPALLAHRYGRGICAVFPWDVGAHYAKQKHAGHAALMIGALEGVLGLERTLIVEASPLIEVRHMRDADGRFEWVGLVNLSGQKDVAGFFEPLPARDIRIRLRPWKPLASVRLLKAGTEVPFHPLGDGRIACAVPELAAYEVAVFEYRE